MASIVQHISLMSDIETISATSYNDLVNLVARKWESGLYDGTVTVYFEATIDPNGSTRTTYAALYDSAGNQVDGSEISMYGGTYNGPILVRSGAITLTNNTEYHVKAKRATGNGLISGARLVIKQSGAITKTATYIDFLPKVISRGGNTYTSLETINWPHDADLYDGITAAYFEASIKHSTGSYSAYAELWNSTDSSQIAEVSDASTTFVRKRSADIKASLADGKNYMVRVKNGGGNTGYSQQASLIIVQENFIKSASVLSAPDWLAATSVNTNLKAYFRLTKADWGTTTITANAFMSGYVANADYAGNLSIKPWDGSAIDTYTGVNDTTLPCERYDGPGGDLYTSLAADEDYRMSGYVGSTVYYCYTGIGGLIIAFTLPIDRTLTAGGSSYSVTGTAATLKKSSLVGAGAGSYAMTGTAATLSYVQGTVTLDAGSADFYILGPLGGKTLKKSLSLVPASPGSIAVTGTAVDFLRSRVLAASAGSYAVTGTAAIFLYNRVFTVSPGSFAVTGTAVDFVAGIGIAAAAGSFTVSGTAAKLCKSHIFTVSEGAFTVTGTAVTFVETNGVIASSGSFAASGTAVGFLKHSVLVADPDKSSTVITRSVADAWEGEFAQASLTTSWTPTDLPDDIAIVCFGLDSRAEVASVTLGGRAFTKLASVEGTGSGYHRGELWYLVNPPHVESEFSITLNDPQGTWTLYRVEHYYNVNQYDPFGDVAATFAAGQSSISGTVEDVQEGQFPFDWVVNTIAWYTLTPGVDQTEIFNLNTGHFARGMSHRLGDTGDLDFSWSFPGIAGDNVHIATVFKQPSFRNTFTIDGTAATLLKIVEMTIHDTVHGITMSGIVLILSTAQLLVIDDSVHAVTMGNITLTMPDTLTINEAVHAITMQNVGLVMPGVLTINDAVHQVTMPNISLGGIAYGGLDAMIQIGGEWKDISTIRVQVGGAWKDVTDITLRQ